MNITKLNAQTLEYYKKGYDLSNSLNAYFLRLDEEFKNQTSLRLQKMAYTGLKIVTGRDMAACCLLAQQWRDYTDKIIQTRDQKSVDEFLETVSSSKWLYFFDKFLSFVIQAPLEAEKFTKSAEEREEAEEIFTRIGVNLVKTIIYWFENNESLKSILQQSSECDQSVELASAGLEATIGLASLNIQKEKVQKVAVKVSNLSKLYDCFEAVKNVSLTIPEGVIFGLLGPNGAGKTSLIECIEGIRQLNSGRIEIFGLTVDSVNNELKERIGVQLQNTGLYGMLTVKETLTLYASFYKTSIDPLTLIQWVDMQDKTDSPVRDLSGGQRQRLSLALALVNDPELLFLDEPTTGLDPHARRNIWQLMQDLRGRGKTILLTTHYMEEAEYLCDRVAIMHNGEIIEQDTPANLIKKHIGEKSIEFDFKGVIDPRIIENLEGVDRFWIRGSRVVIISKDEKATMVKLLETVFPDATMEDLIVRRGNLEDVFLKLTNKGLET
jgi:ABC-2 type transport system ATP-binding protein